MIALLTLYPRIHRCLDLTVKTTFVLFVFANFQRSCQIEFSKESQSSTMDSASFGENDVIYAVDLRKDLDASLQLVAKLRSEKEAYKDENIQLREQLQQFFLVCVSSFPFTSSFSLHCI